jgi:hypothetical protein
MSKFLENIKTPPQPIFIKDVGVSLEPGVYEIAPQEYLLWAASNDIVAPILAGNIVVNDGLYDLSITGGVNSDAINFLKYPDFAPNQRFLSEPERSNDMVEKTTQRAIEEARPDIEDGGSLVQKDANILNFSTGISATPDGTIPRKVNIEIDAFDISKGCFLPSFYLKRRSPGLMFSRSGGFILKRCK